MIDRHGSDPYLRSVPPLAIPEEAEKTPAATPSAFAAEMREMREELVQIEKRLGARLDAGLRDLGDALHRGLTEGLKTIEGTIAATVVNAMATRMVILELAQRTIEGAQYTLRNEFDAHTTSQARDRAELEVRLRRCEELLHIDHPATIPAPAPSEND